MNLIAWCLALALMVTVMIEAVAFQQATVCRQKAWLKGTELQTSTLLYRPKVQAQAFDLGCKLYLKRHHKKVTWRRLPNVKQHHFSLALEGKI